MEVEVNYWAVLLAAVSSMVVGSIWYAKPVFGSTWQKLVGLKDSDMNKGAGYALGLAFALSIITAYVIAHVAYLSNHFFGNSFIQDAVTTSFWLWLGLTAARFATHDAFEHRRKKLTTMNIGNEFVTIVVMGLVIGLIGF
jgi:hypothetical protein